MFCRELRLRTESIRLPGEETPALDCVAAESAAFWAHDKQYLRTQFHGAFLPGIR
jgi:hypothetical protein